MTTVPVVFAFDNNLALPAAVCLNSLLISAEADTVYHIYVMHSASEELDMQWIDKVMCSADSRHRISFIRVDDTFDNAFEIRGITTPAYYRLLIPELIRDYEKVIYSDVDVIFRQDLSKIYNSWPLGEDYLAGVNNPAHLDSDLGKYYGQTLGLDVEKIICSGFLIMNCKKISEDGLVDKFRKRAGGRYKFQDQDILNIECKGRIGMLPPSMSLLTYIADIAVNRRNVLLNMWTEQEISLALAEGNIHYNGQKPWKGYCINFDIWWEYYRKSPIFDEKFYFDFFYGKLNELDRLPLMKRIKILARYFVYGKK